MLADLSELPLKLTNLCQLTDPEMSNSFAVTREQTMAYPLAQAQILADSLSNVASKNGGDVFVSAIQPDERGDDYRKIYVDINRQDWRKLHKEFVALGWTSFGEDSLAHVLPNDTYLIATPKF